jgi:hypothetical protein
LIGRFSRKRGRFGILVCRKIDDEARLLKRLPDVVNNTEGVIICLQDKDVMTLFDLKRRGKLKELSGYLDEKLNPILM